MRALLVTDAVLLEMGNGLPRHSKRHAIDIIEQFLASKEVEIVNLSLGLFTRGFALYNRQKDKAWGLVMAGRESGASPSRNRSQLRCAGLPDSFASWGNTTRFSLAAERSRIGHIRR